jgi:hypothetical protein
MAQGPVVFDTFLLNRGAQKAFGQYIGHVVHYVPLRSYTIVWLIYRRSE